ncbi:MAG: hypothetical protein DHS20C06_01910 [Hyphobacterium sp.]|nr:MAG: hypothetical protein DHS20C06_01910 [Hyphobacterium sp.]
MPVIAIALFGWNLINENGIALAAHIGLFGALTAFLTWALGREMDPDHNATAFIAMALSVMLAALGYGFDLLTIGALLFAVRLANRTVGPQARVGDIITLVSLNLGAVLVDGAWWMPFISVIALVFDETQEHSNLPQRLAIPALIIIGAQAFFTGDGIALSVTDSLVRGWVVTVIVITIMVGGAIWNLPDLRSVMDVQQTPCDRRRIRAGMVLILLGGLASLLGGQDSLAGNLAIWSVLAASIAGRNVIIADDDKNDTPTSVEP